MKQKALGCFLVALGIATLSARAMTSGGAGYAETADITFAKDVAPIIQKNCLSCHRAGEIAPMSFASYADVRPWAQAIRRAVMTRTMPPWHADPNPREFENDARLSQTDIDTIVAWVDGGAMLGDPKDMPPNPAFVDGWNIGIPDIVFSMPEEVTVPATGVIPYKYFGVPTGFTEDTWVQAAEIRFGNRTVAHHVVVQVQEPLDLDDLDQRLRTTLDRVLVAKTPGMPPFTFPPGTAKLIKAGSRLIFQVHYTPNGTAATDRSSVGLVLAKAPVEKAVMTLPIANSKFKIPAGNPNYEVKSLLAFPVDARIVSVFPHMHVRGKDFRYTAIYPDGRREVILNVPKWDFNWQQIYRYKQAIFMPGGSKIECVAHFDNSKGNKFNPDPTKTVSWGEQTWEEMMIGYIDFVIER